MLVSGGFSPFFKLELRAELLTSFAILSYIGLITLHGPHQVAVKSTTIGRLAPFALVSKVSNALSEPMVITDPFDMVPIDRYALVELRRSASAIRM
jgi:hypothetical protein